MPVAMRVASRVMLRSFLAASIVATIGCDRLTKRIATDTLAGSVGRSFLADTVRLEYAENRGGFLGLGEQLPPRLRQTVFVGATGLLMLVLVAAVGRFPRRELAIAGLAFFVAGGLSNWIDRVTDGHVVDFIIMRAGPLHTGVFNVADVAILVGLGVLFVAQLPVASRPDGTSLAQ